MGNGLWDSLTGKADWQKDNRLPQDASPDTFAGNPNKDQGVQKWEGVAPAQPKKAVKAGSKKKEKKPESPKRDDEKVASSVVAGDIEVLHIPSRYYNYEPDTKSHVWIKLVARPIEKQAAWARADKPVSGEARKFEFNFLAPNEIQEIVSHEWAPYESVAAKIAEKAAWLGRAGMEWQNLQSNYKKYKNSADNRGGLLSAVGSDVKKQGAMNTLHSLALAGSQANIFQHRVDTALVYKNSERRKYDFVFYLADVGSDLYNEVIYPVKLLQFLSTPSKDEDGGNKSLASIKAPFYFEIQTTPVDYIKVKFAACTLVQPTWKGPYINGLPSHCELHLSFIEIEPLWDSMFIDDKRITTSTRTGIGAQVPQSPATPAYIEKAFDPEAARLAGQLGSGQADPVLDPDTGTLADQAPYQLNRVSSPANVERAAQAKEDAYNIERLAGGGVS